MNKKFKYHGYWVEDDVPCLVWKIGTDKKTAVRCFPPQVHEIIDSGALGAILGANKSISGGQTDH